MECLVLLIVVAIPILAIGLTKVLIFLRQRFGAASQASNPVQKPDEPSTIWIGYSVSRVDHELYRLLAYSEELRVHALISGKTQMGKSREVSILLLQKLAQKEQVIILDPHGTMFDFMLSTMIAHGGFNGSMMKDKVMFFDLPAATAQGLYPAFNVLNQGLFPYDIAENVLDAIHRVWSELDASSALDDVVTYSCSVLIHHNLPITLVDEFLDDEEFRKTLLKDFPDENIVAYFRNLDGLGPTLRAKETWSTKRRTSRLNFSPKLRYPLSSNEPVNLANWSNILAEGKSVIINLHFPSLLTTKIWGALLMVALEQAANERPDDQARPVTVFVDEFTLFTQKEKSEVTLNNFLQGTLKKRVSLWLCHQGLSTVPLSTQGTLDTNVGMRLAFNLGRKDAEYMAPYFSRVDTKRVKKYLYGPGMPRPIYSPAEEQQIDHQQELMDLTPREAKVRLPDGWTGTILTPEMPDPKVDEHLLAEVKAYYLYTLYRTKERIEEELEQRRQDANVGSDRIKALRELREAAKAARTPGTQRQSTQGTVAKVVQQPTAQPQQTDATISNNAQIPTPTVPKPSEKKDEDLIKTPRGQRGPRKTG